MSLAENPGPLTWADLTAGEKRDAVFRQLAGGRNKAEAAAQLSIIYGPMGANHVSGVIDRHGLDKHPAVREARRQRASLEKFTRLARARARKPAAALPRPALPKMPPAQVGGGQGGVTLFDLKAGVCKRPLWGDDETDITRKFYCGAPAADGKPYCAACAAELLEPRKCPVTSRTVYRDRPSGRARGVLKWR